MREVHALLCGCPCGRPRVMRTWTCPPPSLRLACPVLLILPLASDFPSQIRPAADSFYALFDKHLKEVERGFASAVRDAKLQAPSGPDRKDYMQMLVQRRLGEWTARAQEAVGLSEEEFQACMMRFQKDPRFMMRVFDGQKKQTELMETLDEE